MGLCNLKYVDGEVQKRKEIVLYYRERLSGMSGIRILDEQKDVVSNYAYFPIVIDEEKFGRTRDEIYELFRKNNIYVRRYFYPLTNKCECFKELFPLGNTPVAEYISERVLTLPLYADLRMEEADRICGLLEEKR